MAGAGGGWVRGAEPRVVLVDPAFTSDRSGHHWRLNKGYADLIGADRCWFAVHKSLKRARGISTDRLIPAFSLSFYEAAEVRRLGRLGVAIQGVAYRDSAPIPRQVRAALQGALRRRRAASAEPASTEPVANLRALYRDELGQLIDRMDLRPDEHMVFTSLDARMGRAVLDLIAERGLSRLPALHLRLMYDETTPTAGALDYGALVERLAATGQVGPRLTLHCETEVHARDLADKLGLPVGTAPFPAAALPEPEPIQGRPLRVAFLGEARAEKGFEMLHSVLGAFSAQHGQLARAVSWRIHAGGRTVEATAARDATRARPTPPGLDVRFRFGPVPPATYEQMRAEADVVLALQDPRVYAKRGSGVAQEAVAGGRPIICLEGSSVEAEPGAVVMVARTAEEVADAVAEIARDPGPWLDRAARGRRLFESRLSEAELVAACGRPADNAGEDPPLALVVGPWWPEGGSARLMAMQCEALVELGYQVVRAHLTPPGQAREAILARALRGPDRDRHAVMTMTVEARPAADGGWSFAVAAPRLIDMCKRERFRLVVANFPQTAAFVASLPLGPEVVRVMETHDLALDPFTGERLQAALPPAGGFDAAVFVNDDERAAWAAAGQASAVTILPPIDDRQSELTTAGFEGHDLLFVGSDHARNRASLARLTDEILAHPDCAGISLLVVGGVEATGSVAPPRMTSTGRVDDLGPAYASARLVVVPHVGGGGIPSKLLGALARGMPVVADADAVRFLDGADAIAAEDAADFRARIVRALADPVYLESLAAASRLVWARLAEPGRYRENWRALLQGLQAPSAPASRLAPNRV